MQTVGFPVCALPMLFLTLAPSAGLAQGAPRPQKVLTPEQVAYQQASAQWLDQYTALRHKAQAAYAAEMARDKAGDCPKSRQYARSGGVPYTRNVHH